MSVAEGRWSKYDPPNIYIKKNIVNKTFPYARWKPEHFTTCNTTPQTQRSVNGGVILYHPHTYMNSILPLNSPTP